MGSRSKRIRSESRSAATQDTLSDCEAAGAGPAERKRELERNRRNLVNVRFAELENQLAQLPGAPTRVHRRLDKEVVLKDAAQSLAAQQRDLDDAIRRISTMTTEIEILRSEKLELRHDKAYLHNEITKAREENETLVANNNALWDALRKTGAVKMPIDLLLRPAHLLCADNPHTANAKAVGQENRSRHVATTNVDTCTVTENATECARMRERLPMTLPKQERTLKENGRRNGLPTQTAAVNSNDLFENYSVAMPTDNGKTDGNGEDNEEYMKLADDFRLRGLNPMMMMQYAFDDAREIPQIHMAMDDVSNQGLPDMAPCG